METFGVIVIVGLTILFGISALANAYEYSQRHKQ